MLAPFWYLLADTTAYSSPREPSLQFFPTTKVRPMATSAIAAPSNLSTTAASSLKLDDLLRVLLTELTHQNPLKPVDNKDFMAQIAQFASLESSQRLNQGIDQLLTLQAINQSVGLLGKRVTANADSGPVSGTVTALTLENGVPRMTITPASGPVVVGVSIGQLQLVRSSN
jgi:flagellar basal-body rod modification protein FlgD